MSRALVQSSGLDDHKLNPYSYAGSHRFYHERVEVIKGGEHEEDAVSRQNVAVCRARGVSNFDLRV